MGRQAKPPARKAKSRAQMPDSTSNRKVRKPSKAVTGLWIALMLLFFVEGLFYTWCRIQCLTVGYGIDDEISRYRTLITARNNLRIELARLKAPARIEAIARTRLGMVMPDSQQTVVLR